MSWFDVFDFWHLIDRIIQFIESIGFEQKQGLTDGLKRKHW